MVNMFDRDNSGTIGFSEFTGLWKYIEDWKNCFKSFDKDNSGNINSIELLGALRAFGYNLSDNFVNLLVIKFGKKGSVI